MDENQQETQADMSDDDIASQLGFITSLSEQHHMASQGESSAEDDLQETTPGKDAGTDTPSHDSNQDAEIQSIKDELDMLKREIENDQGPETTTDTGATQ